jgi:hypothetical protein
VTHGHSLTTGFRLRFRVFSVFRGSRNSIVTAKPCRGGRIDTYATEADLLNVALFGQTVKQWREANPSLDGNVREYATVEQLLVSANIEGHGYDGARLPAAATGREERKTQDSTCEQVRMEH